MLTCQSADSISNISTISTSPFGTWQHTDRGLLSLLPAGVQDGDTVDTTNRNRQLPALKSTVGQLKAEVVAGRLKDINPEIQLTVKQVGAAADSSSTQ